MAAFNASEAVSFMGRRVQFLVSADEEPPVERDVFVLGVVQARQGVWDHPCFVVMDASGRRPREFPDELFWSDIKGIRGLEGSSGASLGLS